MINVKKTIKAILTVLIVNDEDGYKFSIVFNLGLNKKSILAFPKENNETDFVTANSGKNKFRFRIDYGSDQFVFSRNTGFRGELDSEGKLDPGLDSSGVLDSRLKIQTGFFSCKYFKNFFVMNF
jgi:hypothetical protein